MANVASADGKSGRHNHLLYSASDINGPADKKSNTIRIEKLYQLLSALDDVALRRRNGAEFYPDWIIKDVKELYDVLRRTYDQVCRGVQVDITREELQRRIEQVRHGLVHVPAEKVSRSRSASPKRPFVPLFRHEPGSQYCLESFRTVKHKGEYFHTPGAPNANTHKDLRSRKWLAETSKKRSTSLPKQRRRKPSKKKSIRTSSSRKVRELVDRAEMLEQRLDAETRRELRAEEAIAGLRRSDNSNFSQMMQRVDRLIDTLATRPQPPPPQPAPVPPPPVETVRESKVVVDDSRIRQLEAEIESKTALFETEKRLLKEHADTLAAEIERARKEADSLRHKNASMEEELMRLRSFGGDTDRLKQHLEEKCKRLEETVKKFQRSEKRHRAHIEDLEKELKKLKSRNSQLKKDLDTAQVSEAELRAIIKELESRPSGPGADAVRERLNGVVSRVMLRLYHTRYRKEHQVRKELQNTVDTLTDSLQRLEKMHQTEIESTRGLLQKEALQLRDTISQKRAVNTELSQNLAELQKRLQREQDEHSNMLANIRRNSVGEVQKLQMQLITLRRESMKKAEEAAVTPSYASFIDLLSASFQGDYLRMEDVPAVLHIMFEHGDKRVVFSDFVEKLNHRNFKQKRSVVVSQTHIYFLMPKGNDLRRLIKIEDVDKITMSRRASNLLVIHHKSEHDYFFQTPKRPEIVYHLMRAYEALTSKKISFHFAERFYVEDRDLHYRCIEVPESQNVKLGRSMLLGPS